MRVTTGILPKSSDVVAAPVTDCGGNTYRFLACEPGTGGVHRIMGCRPWQVFRQHGDVGTLEVTPVEGGCVVAFDVPDGLVEPEGWDMITLELQEVGSTNASGGDSDLARVYRLAMHAAWLDGRPVGEAVSFPVNVPPPAPTLLELLEWLRARVEAGIARALKEDWNGRHWVYSVSAWGASGWSGYIGGGLDEYIRQVREWRPSQAAPSRSHEVRIGPDVVARLWATLTPEQINASIGRGAGLYGAVWDNVGPLTPRMVEKTINYNFPFTSGSADDVVTQACAAMAGITCGTGPNEDHRLVREWRAIQAEKLASLGLEGWPLRCLDDGDVRVPALYGHPKAGSVYYEGGPWLEYVQGSGLVPIPAGETPDTLLRAEILRMYPGGCKLPRYSWDPPWAPIAQATTPA